jgi:hypothetical protein
MSEGGMCMMTVSAGTSDVAMVPRILEPDSYPITTRSSTGIEGEKTKQQMFGNRRVLDEGGVFYWRREFNQGS